MRVRLMPLGVVTKLEPGERLLDALDDIGLPALPTACRAANCGICIVIVQGDGGAFAQAGPEERKLLAGLGASAGQRLGCQIHAPSEASDTEVVVEVLAARRGP